MTRFALISFLALFATACTEVPPPPGTGGAGGGGAGGIGGQVGGGGRGAVAGSGGSSDAGVDTCDLSRADGTESNDIVQDGLALGFVCSDGQCREGLDPFDRWSVEGCSGRYTILLTWTNDDDTSNLELALFSASEDLLDQSVRPSGNEEEVTYSLQASDGYTVEVRAETTAGLKRDYDLSVSQTE